MTATQLRQVPAVSSARYLSLLETIAWLLVGLSMLLGEGSKATLAAFAILGIVHSGLGFWRHGGPHLTAAGIYLAGTALFGFYPALSVATRGAYFDDTYALPAVVILYFTQILMYAIFWAPYAHHRRASFEPPDPAAMTFSFWFGALLVVVGIFMEQVLGSTELASAPAYLGVIMVAAGAILSSERFSLFRALIVLVVVGFYVSTMFSGGGRLVLGTMAAAIALLLNLRWPGRWLKLGMLIALPAGITILAEFRSDVVYATRAGAQESGLESVLWPFERFSQLVGMVDAGSLSLALGGTFIASALVLVPRAIWPEKSEGFGVDLTGIFRPDLLNAGHSEAGLFAGEWIYNFGFFGLVLMVLVAGWWMKFLDLRLNRRASTPLRDKRDLFFLLALVLFVSGLFDLVWNGTSTYAARTIMRLAILIVLFFLFMWKKPQKERRMPLEGSVPHHPEVKDSMDRSDASSNDASAGYGVQGGFERHTGKSTQRRRR